jgi:hypothetical protein
LNIVLRKCQFQLILGPVFLLNIFFFFNYLFFTFFNFYLLYLLIYNTYTLFGITFGLILFNFFWIFNHNLFLLEILFSIIYFFILIDCFIFNCARISFLICNVFHTLLFDIVMSLEFRLSPLYPFQKIFFLGFEDFSWNQSAD